MKIDLHIHLEERPMEYALQTLLRLKDFGCDGGVIVEHNAVKPPAWWRNLLDNAPAPVFFGCEYSSAEGHILIITPTGSFDFDELFMPMQQAVDMAVKAGGVAIPAHPYSRNHSRKLGDGIYNLNGISAVETINGAISLECNQLAQEAATKMGLPSTGGSDAHNPFLVARAYTLFNSAVSTQKELTEALLMGNFTAAYAPTYNP